MHYSQEDEKSCFKLAQLWQTAKTTYHKTFSYKRIINKILDGDFNINHKLTILDNSSLESAVNLKDCTALHILYHNPSLDLITFDICINRGADFTEKNGNGQTVVHIVMTDILKYSIYEISRRLQFVNSVLSAHVKYKNVNNPRDSNGYSHLQGACIANHVEALTLFLDNGASADEAVNPDAPEYAGYTPLHFAMKFMRLQVAQLLVSRGANVNALTAKGKSPLDMLVVVKPSLGHSSEIALSDIQAMIRILVDKGAVSNAFGWSALHVACRFKDFTYAKQLLDRGADINDAIPATSLICPGYTALHFAECIGLEAMKILSKRGAKMIAVNADGRTPLDLCLRKDRLQNAYDLLSHIDNGKEIVLSDGSTQLRELMLKANNYNQFRLFLQNDIADVNAAVPSNCGIWPGYTILHLLVIFSCHTVPLLASDMRDRAANKIATECLQRGLNINARNDRGQTAIHLAFREGLFGNGILKLMLEHLKTLDSLTNELDEDSLSYLHIACEMEDVALVKKLLERSSPNVSFSGRIIGRRSNNLGPTPLHIATSNKSHVIAKLLLRRGADVHAPDHSGFTPIHWLLEHYSRDYREIASVLFKGLLANLEDRVVDGLGYLHIACYMSHAEIVRQLLRLDSKVDEAIRSDRPSIKNFLSSSRLARKRHLNLTPLQMAVEAPNEQILDLLLRRVIDGYVKQATPSRQVPINFYARKYSTPEKSLLRCFFHILCFEEDLQQLMQEKMGLTKLHIACYMRNEQAVKSILDEDVDVNAQVSADSIIFAGCTPLHLLIRRTNYYNLHHSIDHMINLLLERGADVTISNGKRCTPIHQLFSYEHHFVNVRRNSLNAQLDFSINPVNENGVSHLHIASYWHEYEIVERFLQHSCININQPTGYFNGSLSGSTALHVALSNEMAYPTDNWTKLSKTINVLLKYGADVGAKDVRGDTPLHKAIVFRTLGISLLENLLSHGGDMTSQNIRSQTPIEARVATNVSPSDSLNIFQKFNYQINSWNEVTREGYIPKLFSFMDGDISRNIEFQNFMKSSDAKTIDSMGRTAIHNVVAESDVYWFDMNLQNYTYAIEKFMDIGIDIEHRDAFGQTAIHYAADMENGPGIQALLECGADINVVDNSGNIPLHYAKANLINNAEFSFTNSSKSIAISLQLHMKKMQYLGIEVTQVNRDMMEEVEHYFNIMRHINSRVLENDENYDLSEAFLSQVQVAKTIDIGINSLTLFDYLTEPRVINSYSFLIKSKRDKVDIFFKSNAYASLDELVGIIKYQYYQMTRRYKFIDSALSSLRTHMGFSIPGMCEEISLSLSNFDLKNLIRSTSDM